MKLRTINYLYPSTVWQEAICIQISDLFEGGFINWFINAVPTSVGERSLPGVHKSAKRQDGPVLLFQDDCLNLWSEMNQVGLVSCQSAIVEKNPIWDHLSRDCHVWQKKKMT